MKEFTCIICPRGCRLKVDDELHVTGNSCPRGEAYGRQEAVDPRRTLTSTVRIEGAMLNVAPVKTASPIPKGKIDEAMRQINSIKLQAPVYMGEPVCENLAGTGIDLVSTRDLEKVK